MGRQGPHYRRFCKICWWGGRCWRYATSGSLRGATNYAIIGTGLLGFVAEWSGHPVSFGEGWRAAVVSGLVYMAIAWLVIFVSRLLISPFRLYSDGEWHGQRFVYREPKLAFHTFASPAKNNFAHNFYFPDAPPFSTIHYQIEIGFGGQKSYISLDVGPHWKGLRDFQSYTDHRYGGGSFTVGKDRRMWLTYFMHQDADPFSVRIYVTGWEVGNGNAERNTPRGPISSLMKAFK